MNRLITQTQPANLGDPRHPAVIEVLETAEKKVAESLAIRQVAHARGGDGSDSLESEEGQASYERVRYMHD